jgi:VIT1/CCC1 family predicted Fe2+/Mn2+ transporter
MSKSLNIGRDFGMASAVITTLGLMIGLESSTSSKIAIIGGIITIAVADAFSDALGIHIAKESEGNFSTREVWQATISTFAFKAVFACSFLIPVFLLPLPTSIYAAIAWGLMILITQSYYLAKTQGTKPWRIIREHLLIAIAVILITHFTGLGIARLFR